MMLPWTVWWLTVMSNSSHRGLRHTGTEVAMTLMVQLTEVLRDLEAQKVATQRQQLAKKRVGTMQAGTSAAASPAPFARRDSLHANN